MSERRSTNEKKILDRISRMEGQLKGIRKMIEEKRECIDIITQISAMREAVGMLGAELMKDDMICKRDSGEEITDEYVKKIFKMR